MGDLKFCITHPEVIRHRRIFPMYMETYFPELEGMEEVSPVRKMEADIIVCSRVLLYENTDKLIHRNILLYVVTYNKRGDIVRVDAL